LVQEQTEYGVMLVAIQSTALLPKYIKIRKHKTITLPVVLYGCETWSLTLREKHRLRVFQNWVLRRVFGPREMGGCKNNIMRSFITCTLRQV
jgi:hypothetical protein